MGDIMHYLYNSYVSGDYGKAMSELSKGESGACLVTSQSKAVNLEALIKMEKEILSCTGNPHSCDAWYIGHEDEIYYLFEFKGGTFNFNEQAVKCPHCSSNFKLKSKSSSKHEILLKCTESLLFVLKLMNETIDFSRQNIKFVLVVEDGSPLVEIHRHATKRANMPFIPEEISRLNKMYFKEA